MKTNLRWCRFSGKLGSWASKLKPFFDDGGFNRIYDVLKEESGRGIKITPDSADVFQAFRECSIEDLKCVILAYCPYHVAGAADGMALSCSKIMKLQPTLNQLYGAWETEFNEGLCLGCDRNPDLTFLAHQGVLLLNTALTTRIGEAGAHQDLWEPFTKYVLEEIITPSMVPVIMLGKQASEFIGCFLSTQHVFQLSHPASASYRKEIWNSEGVFTKVNKILMETNGEEINWLLEPAPF